MFVISLTLQRKPGEWAVCECCDAPLVPEVFGKTESLTAACYMQSESLFTGLLTVEQEQGLSLRVNGGNMWEMNKWGILVVWLKTTLLEERRCWQVFSATFVYLKCISFIVDLSFYAGLFFSVCSFCILQLFSPLKSTSQGSGDWMEGWGSWNARGIYEPFYNVLNKSSLNVAQFWTYTFKPLPLYIKNMHS